MTVYIIYLVMVIVQNVIISNMSFLDGYLRKKIFLILSCVEMILMVSLRGNTVGADTVTYVNALNAFSELSTEELWVIREMYPYKFELGYLWLTKLCAMVELNYTVFLTIIAILIYVPLYRLIYKYSPYPLLSIILYFGLGFFAYSLGIFRQFIALSIVIAGTDFIIKREIYKWLLTVFFASLFHKSSLICLPLYFLQNLNYMDCAITSLVFQFVFLLLGRDLLELVFQMIDYYRGYIGSSFDKNGGSYISLIVFEAMMFFGAIHYKLRRNFNNLQFVLNSVPVICVLQVLAYQFNLFGRTIIYYSIFLILYIPIMINDIIKNKHKQFANVIIIILGLMIFVYKTLTNEYITPFIYFWDSNSI